MPLNILDIYTDTANFAVPRRLFVANQIFPKYHDGFDKPVIMDYLIVVLP